MPISGTRRRALPRRVVAISSGIAAIAAVSLTATPAAAVVPPEPIPAGIYVSSPYGQPGSTVGMLFAGNAPCNDDFSREWAFVDGGGAHPVAMAGFGEDAVGVYRVIELSNADTGVPLSLGGASRVDGTIRLTCTPDAGGAAEVFTFPFTLSSTTPASRYHSPAQWTWYTPGAAGAGSTITVNAVGFAPGETITVNLTNYTAWDRNDYVDLDGVFASPVTVTADGDGAVTADVVAPAGWLPGDEIAPLLAGASSHYALSGTEGTSLESDPTLTITSGGSAFRGGVVAVTASGFAPHESVVVALHSSSAPAVNLATLSADASGRITGTVRVPTNALLGAQRLWAGSKSVSYLLLNAPLQVVNAPTVGRIAGATRYDVGVLVSSNAYPTIADVVFVATGANYPDALSAGALAARAGGPLLLTPGNQLLPSVAAEIERLDPEQIVVVGGPNSVNPDVFAALAALQPNTVRISGADRFEASRNLVDEGWGHTGAPLVYLATGLNFPDALSAGAAAGHVDAPVLLVNGLAPSLDAATLDLLAALGVQDVKIAGGPNSMSVGIETQLTGLLGAGHVKRLSGPDRFAASEVISRDAFGSDGASRVFVATGLNFPDALAGSAWAGVVDAPLFVVPGACVPSRVQEDIAAFGAEQVTLLGGVNSLSPAVGTFAAC